MTSRQVAARYHPLQKIATPAREWRFARAVRVVGYGCCKRRDPLHQFPAGIYKPKSGASPFSTAEVRDCSHRYLAVAYHSPTFASPRHLIQIRRAAVLHTLTLNYPHVSNAIPIQRHCQRNQPCKVLVSPPLLMAALQSPPHPLLPCLSFGFAGQSAGL